MYNRSDPRFRRTINQITHNLESANEATQVGLFSFNEHYIKPCFNSLAASIEPCTAPCFPRRQDRRRRQRARSRSRPELNFDFYDDWENDENDALLSLESDEFERIVGGTTSQDNGNQPGPQGSMNYGSREQRRRSAGPFDGRPDPTIIPSQSRFGFLSKLPFNIGGKGLRYKPSAADLQERPMAKDRHGLEQDNLDEDIEEEEEEEEASRWRGLGRKRSNTTGSGHTADSLSSRGDLFPSDDEDDAVPLDDEFTMVLEHRNTYDDSSSGRTRRSLRPGATRSSTRTASSRSIGKPRMKSSHSSTPRSRVADMPAAEMATLLELKLEEQRTQAEEERDILRKREAARRLALERGLSQAENETKLNAPNDKVERDHAVPSEQFITDPSGGFPFPTMHSCNDKTSARAKSSTESDVRQHTTQPPKSSNGGSRHPSIGTMSPPTQPTNDV